MPINVLMPALSPTMEKGNLAKWLKKEGDTIKSGDVIAEIETDKATMEVEAIDEGMLAKILVPEGTADVPVNDLIAADRRRGRGSESVTAPAGGAAPPKRPRPQAEPARPPPHARGSRRLRRVRTRPPRRPAARQAPSGPPGERPNGAAPAARAGASSPRRSPAASPSRTGIDLSAVQGSGPHGRMIENDVRAAVAGGTAKAARGAGQPRRRGRARRAQKAAAAPARAGAQPDQVRGLYEKGAYEEVPLDGMRKTIAKRLDRGEADGRRTSTSRRLRARRADGAARADQRRRAEGQGRQARLQALGQRLRHQGVGASRCMRVPAANAVWAEDRVLR